MKHHTIYEIEAALTAAGYLKNDDASKGNGLVQSYEITDTHVIYRSYLAGMGHGEQDFGHKSAKLSKKDLGL